MLYIELYEKTSDSFINEIDISGYRDLIERVIHTDTGFCNPEDISYSQFILLQKEIAELNDYNYNDYDFFVQDRSD